MVQHVGNEFTAAVGLVTQAETARQCEDLRLADGRSQLIDGVLDSRLVQVLENQDARFSTCILERLRRVVVAVGAGEDGQNHLRRADFRSRFEMIVLRGTSEFCTHGSRFVSSHFRIELTVETAPSSQQRRLVELFAVDDEVVSHLTQLHGERCIQLLRSFHDKTTVTVCKQVFICLNIKA